MKIYTLSSLLSLFPLVWAGGYQGCLERIYMYQVYLIDGINPASSQTMGMQCKGANWDNNRKICRGEWTPMKGHTAAKRITYDQWISNLGSAPSPRGWTVPGTDGMDIEATALRTYNMYTAQRPGQSAEVGKVKNFGARMFMLDTVEWNDAIKKTSKLVEQTYKNVGSLDTAKKQLFTDLDKTRRLILDARIGDHGKFLVQDARTRLANVGITVVTRNVGTNPVPRPPPDDNPWDTVDWKETIRQAENAGIADAKAQVQTVAKAIYERRGEGNAAREHKQVIDSYRSAEAAKLGCGRS